MASQSHFLFLRTIYTSILQISLASLIALNTQLGSGATTTPVTAELVEAPAQVQSLHDIITTKAEAAGIDSKVALKVAFCESTLRQYDKDGNVLRGIHNSDDVGLFQINEHYHLKKSQELGFNIYTTEGNIDYAMWLMKNEGIYHWKWSKPCWSKA